MTRLKLFVIAAAVLLMYVGQAVAEETIPVKFQLESYRDGSLVAATGGTSQVGKTVPFSLTADNAYISSIEKGKDSAKITVNTVKTGLNFTLKPSIGKNGQKNVLYTVASSEVMTMVVIHHGNKTVVVPSIYVTKYSNDIDVTNNDVIEFSDVSKGVEANFKFNFGAENI